MASLHEFFNFSQLSSWVGGKMIRFNKEKKSTLKSPTTKKAWKTLSLASPSDVKKGIAAAHEAFPEWRSVSFKKKGTILRKLAALIEDNRSIFAEAMILEMGKTKKDALAEVTYSLGFFAWFAGEAERVFEKRRASSDGAKTLEYRFEPIGVAGLITPWNFPLAMPARKVAAALAAGCTVVLKPSPECPVTALLLARACQIAGVPDGAVNIVIGEEEEVGEALLDSPLVKKLGFTGSTEVGRFLYERSAPTLKKLTLELGGHAPGIIFDDADLEETVKQVIAAKFRNNGQTCIAINRLYVQSGIYSKFQKALIKEIKKLKAGDPRVESTDLTTVLHPASTKKVKAHLKDALAKGAKAPIQGKHPYEPTLLTGVKKNMKLMKEETFGPVLPLIKFKTLEEAVEEANSTPYGLASYLFTQSMATSEKVASELQYGIIGVNDGLPSAPEASFGGVKDSGFGREGGPTGIYEYLREKFISTKISP